MMYTTLFRWYAAILIYASVSMAGFAHAQRLMDLVDVQGVRGNQLIGYGLVVGLDGSGDKTRQTEFTGRSVVNMLRQLGIQLPAGTDPNLKNVAAVSVTATLPAFARPGQDLDVTVSSIGDAKSLSGGTLLMTPLRGIDGNVYAMAQGNLVVSGMRAGGESGSQVVVNTPTVGRIPNGAVVENSVPSSFNNTNQIVLYLKEPSFTNARNLTRTINNLLGAGTASAKDGVSITVRAPGSSDQRVTYMALLEELEINTVRAPARVVINSRTGTVVMNEDVRLSTAAVSHGNLVVSIQENSVVSQPGDLSTGTTAVVPESEVQISQGPGQLFELKESTSLQDVITALNNVGATSSDLMAVLQALKQSGSLHAELVVI
jgi:flagellar P-ring protein precursor FlgI